jgi:O-antigen ligase
MYKGKKQLVDFCFYAFIAVLPFTLILTPVFIGLVITFFIPFGDKERFLIRFKEKKIVWILIGFYVLHIIGLLFSSNINYNRIDTQLLIILVPLVFLALNLKLIQISSAKKIYVISCVVFCLFALLTFFYNLIVNYEHRLNYNFVQRSMYHYHFPYDALYINAAYILLLFNSNFKRFKLVFSILFFTVVILFGVRTGLATFLFITGIYLFFNFKQFFNLKSLLVLLSILLLSFLLIRNSKYVNDKFFDSLSKLGFNTEQYVSDIGAKYHKITLREKLWSSAKEAFNKSPNKILGYGPQGSREILDKIYKKNEYDISGINSHNQYLTTCLNNGVLGLLFLIAIFITALILSFKIKSIQNALLVLIITLAFITESMLERQKGVTFFAVFISLIFIEFYLKKENQSKTL